MTLSSKTLAISSLLAFVLTSCDKQPAKPTDAVAVRSDKQAVQTENAAQRIAYVEIDSLMTQYQYCKDKKAALEAKAKQYEAQVKSKQAQFQKAMVEFQQKVQSGAFSSQAEGEAAQAKLQKLQEQGIKLEQSLSAKMAKEQENFNKVLRDSVQSYLKTYNKTAGYAIILSKQGDNVLYADGQFNITREIIEGLNKRYSK